MYLNLLLDQTREMRGRRRDSGGSGGLIATTDEESLAKNQCAVHWCGHEPASRIVTYHTEQPHKTPFVELVFMGIVRLGCGSIHGQTGWRRRQRRALRG